MACSLAGARLLGLLETSAELLATRERGLGILERFGCTSRAGKCKASASAATKANASPRPRTLAAGPVLHFSCRRDPQPSRGAFRRRRARTVGLALLARLELLVVDFLALPVVRRAVRQRTVSKQHGSGQSCTASSRRGACPGPRVPAHSLLLLLEGLELAALASRHGVACGGRGVGGSAGQGARSASRVAAATSARAP